MMTALSYARWIELGEYREPMRLEPGELAYDLLARLEPRTPHGEPSALPLPMENLNGRR